MPTVDKIPQQEQREFPSSKELDAVGILQIKVYDTRKLQGHPKCEGRKYRTTEE